MGLLDGMVVLITGGARGQGRAHAVASARQGADVVLFDVASDIETAFYPGSSKEDLQETAELVRAEGRRVIEIVGDVRSQHDLDLAVSEAVSQFGKVDALIANAAIVGPQLHFWEMDEPGWLDVLNINLSGVWRSVKAVAPHMIERQAGSIVITASVCGLEASEFITSYVAAKHGLIGLAKNVALEMGPSGVRCNVICPGGIDTPMTDNQPSRDVHHGVGATREELVHSVYHYHLLKGRSLLPPEVIADAAVFFNSSLAQAVTGTVLPVDAGHLVLPGFNHTPIRPGSEAAPASERMGSRRSTLLGLPE